MNVSRVESTMAGAIVVAAAHVADREALVRGRIERRQIVQRVDGVAVQEELVRAKRHNVALTLLGGGARERRRGIEKRAQIGRLGARRVGVARRPTRAT